MKQLTCIDLFCGCGGFSLGIERAGLSVVAAIDFNEEAVTVFKKNFPHVPQALQKDLTKFPPAELAKLISQPSTNNSQRPTVDVIVGGPPCQGFSTVRQRDGANSGPRMIEDKRRYLYQEFLRYVEFFQPKVFVMENVLGIKSAAGGKYFAQVQKEARAMGYRVHPQVEKAFELGVPQKRRRQLIIGTRLDMPDYFSSELKPAPRAVEWPTLGEAIGDLPALKAGRGEEKSEYDMERRKAHVAKYSRRYLYETLEVQRATKLTAHRARPHSERDLRDFAKLREGEHCTEAMKRGEEFEFPYNKGSFKDRYTRQHRNEPCSTIVAHLSKDGLMFIHPTQNRSLTPREAARVQSFPDWFEFPIARTHQFRVIGNAVPPLVGEAVGIAVKKYLENAMKKTKSIRFLIEPLHTFAHVLINQLSFDCGYGSASLRERIYCDFKDQSHPMQGVLIYTASGDSEGTMGGLVRQGHPDRFEATLSRAMRNASWCSSDPVCIESAGQGADNANLAACHGCCLLPETSCEEGNRLLDRALLVGTPEKPSLGFFSSLSNA